MAARSLRRANPPQTGKGLPSAAVLVTFSLNPFAMKKLLIVLGSLLALVAIGLFVASFFLGSIVTKGVNRFAPGITGTAVTLDSASISPLSGAGTLNQLLVGNPPGWKSDKAFSFGKVHVSVEPRSLLGEHIIVNEVHIEAPEFVYETKIISSNIKEILNNIEKSIGGGTQTPGEQPTTKEGKPLKFEVKRFRLENAKVTLGVGATALSMPMPPLVLTDLGTKEGGITANQLATKIVANILANITKAVADSALNIGSASGAAGADAASDAAKKAGEGIRKLFGGEKDQ
jgi:energy-coupling factor transporter transmembrane protein EcfT